MCYLALISLKFEPVIDSATQKPKQPFHFAIFNCANPLDGCTSTWIASYKGFPLILDRKYSTHQIANFQDLKYPLLHKLRQEKLFLTLVFPK